MLYFFKILLLLIKIDQETVLNWFGIEGPNSLGQSDYVSDLSLETFKLIFQGLWTKLQNGLTLSDIESILFLILFIRFLILAIRYNLKTSFYITCIGLFAGYLWYRHLIDLISMYRTVLIKLPFFYNLGVSAVELRSVTRQTVLTDFKLGESVNWYNPLQLIYYAFTKGIVDVDPETGLGHYIDPISMIVSNLKEPQRSQIWPIYYKIYNGIIPKVYYACSKFWTQLSGLAAYAVLTRIGKRYCPYLVRWHWTFLILIGLVEHVFYYFIYRVFYFQEFVLIPKLNTSNNYVDESLYFQIDSLNLLTATIVIAHIGLVLFGMFHAIWGQYFYFPFFVENTELHIGPRPKNSVYSGGNTSWQDEKEKNVNRFSPKLWYGWFGRGTEKSWSIFDFLKKFIKRIIKKLKKQFRK